MVISHGDTVGAEAPVVTADENLADLVLSLIFRKGRSLERFPRSESGVKTISGFCRRHLVGATVVSALGDSVLPTDMLAALTDTMRDRGENVKALRRQLACAMAAIQPALDHEGIPWRLIKGPHLEQSYYGTWAREYFDLDILVPKHQFPRARRVLKRLGWVPHKRGLMPLRLVRGFEHGLGMKRGEAIVDLHWSLRVRPAYSIDEDRVFAAAGSLLYAGVEVPVLDAEYDLTICLLSIAQGIERERVVLRDAIDLYLVLTSVDATISWEAYFREREREGTKRICVSLLAAAVSWLDEENALPNLRYELGQMGALSPLTELNPLKNCVCLNNAQGAGLRWYLSVYDGGKGHYWLHRSMSVVLNQEFPYNLPRTSLFRRFVR